MCCFVFHEPIGYFGLSLTLSQPYLVLATDIGFCSPGKTVLTIEGQPLRGKSARDTPPARPLALAGRLPHPRGCGQQCWEAPRICIGSLPHGLECASWKRSAEGGGRRCRVHHPSFAEDDACGSRVGLAWEPPPRAFVLLWLVPVHELPSPNFSIHDSVR